jgi:hypothetical protein
MALTAVEYHLFRTLRATGALPPRPHVLELGESEWYGDVPETVLQDAIDAESDPARRAALHASVREALASGAPRQAFSLAKCFYAIFLDYGAISAIDFHGTPAARKIDLNYPVELAERFHIVIDIGTAEHVFNVFQFFKTCHELTRPGGLMIHANPFRGWLEHGFYNFNPTFYWDLAAANGYDMVMLLYSEIDPLKVIQLDARESAVALARDGALGANAMLHCVLQKPDRDRPFAVPLQGFYAGTISETMARAWYEVR